MASENAPGNRIDLLSMLIFTGKTRRPGENVLGDLNPRHQIIKQV
jgi:hypothetical protein